MTSIADKALLIRIRNKDNKLQTLIVTVMRTLEVSDLVLDALDHRIASERIIWGDLLPYLKKHSRNKLFEVYCEHFPPNLFDAAELFKMGFGKEYFEDRLCKELYDTSIGKGLGMYSYLFEALSEHGGPKSLEMMEVIKHELYAVIKTNRIVADAISDGFSEEKGFSVGEPTATTDSSGAFTLTATAAQISSYSVVVSAIAGTTIDQDTPKGRRQTERIELVKLRTSTSTAQQLQRKTLLLLMKS